MFLKFDFTHHRVFGNFFCQNFFNLNIFTLHVTQSFKILLTSYLIGKLVLLEPCDLLLFGAFQCKNNFAS
jgi:hypothetical protein